MSASRDRVWTWFNADTSGSSPAHTLHQALMALILLNLAAVIARSVSAIAVRFGTWLDAFEFFSVTIFTLEYLLRAWSAGSDPRYAGFGGRIRYLLTPMAIIDLVAILPFYLAFLSVDLRVLRALRLVRLARIARLGRYSEASGVLLRVLRAKREELVLTMSMLLILALFCATAMYYVEGPVQPDKFPDIPSSFWWAIITITTVGYGDVFPITVLGRVVAALTTLIGILMIALPTGVFGAAFVEELNRKSGSGRHCRHCGREGP